MAARSASSTGPMAFVTQSEFAALTTSLNSTMEDLKRVFAETDLKFNAVEQRVVIIEQVVTAELQDLKDSRDQQLVQATNHEDKLQHLNTKSRLMEDAVSGVEASFQHMLGEMSASVGVMEKAGQIVQNLEAMASRTENLEILMLLAENAARNHNERITKMEATGTNQSHRGRDILDPKNLTVNVFDGTKKLFVAWRKSVEVYMSRFYPEADQLLVYMRRCTLPVQEADLEDAASQAGIEWTSLKWAFNEMSKDGGTYIKTKLGADPTESVASVGDGFFNIYAQLSQEYDKLDKETEGQLQGEFAKLADKQAKSLAETKAMVKNFERQAKEVKERCSKDIDISLKRSVLIAILDPDTKMSFVKDKILGDYMKMREELTNLFCDGLDGGAVPMDCNSVSVNASTHNHQQVAQQHMQAQTGMHNQQNHWDCPQCTGLNAFGKGGRPPVKCWNCGGEHPTKLCPEPLKPEVAEKVREYENRQMSNKGKGKGGEWRPNPWGSKGKGKDGKGGKGHKGKGKTGLNSLGGADEWSQAAWYDWQAWESWNPTSAAMQPKPVPVKSLKGFNSITRVKQLNMVRKVDNFEDENKFKELMEPEKNEVQHDMKKTWEKDERRRRDNQEVIDGYKPMGKDNPEWLRAHEIVRSMFDLHEKKAMIKAEEDQTAEDDNGEGWNVKVSRGSRRTQSGKKTKVTRPRRWCKMKPVVEVDVRPVDVLTRVKEHGELLAV